MAGTCADHGLDGCDRRAEAMAEAGVEDGGDVAGFG
jgi:hypothetical protein